MAKIVVTSSGNDYKKLNEQSTRIVDFTNQHSRNIAMRYESVDSANIKIPEIGKTHFYITSKALSLFNILNWLEEKRGKFMEVVIIVFAINEITARYIVELSKRTKLKLIVSDILNSQREKERLITRLLEQGNMEVVFCHSHAKIISGKIGDEHFTITGSMNMGGTAKIETLEIFNSKKMYNFVVEQYEYLKQHFRINPRYYD